MFCVEGGREGGREEGAKSEKTISATPCLLDRRECKPFVYRSFNKFNKRVKNSRESAKGEKSFDKV